MLHAFPVSRTELFVTNYLSGLVLMVIPQFICALFMNLTILGHANNVIWAVWAWLAITFGETLFFYGLACFVVMYTGQLPVAPLFYFIWNFLYLGVIGLIDALAASFLFGVNDMLIPMDANPLTPFIYLATKVGFTSSPKLTDEGILLYTNGIHILLVYVGVGLLLTAAAWYTYQKRGVETAGEFISIRWAKPLFRWGCAYVLGVAVAEFIFFVLGANYSYGRRVEIGFTIFLALFAGIFFLASQMFIDRSFKVFNKKVLRECGICMASIAVVFILFRTDVFGIEKHVPDADKIESVSTNGLEWSDPEDIAKIVDAHQAIVGDRKHLKNSIRNQESAWESEDFYSINLRYQMKNGKKITRLYTFILDSENEVTASIRNLNQLTADPDSIKRAQFGDNYDSAQIKISGAHLSYADGWVNEGTDDAWLQYADTNVLGNKEELEKLYQAVLTDIDNGALIFQYSFNGNNAKKLNGVSRYYASLELDMIINGNENRYVWLELDTKCNETIKTLVELGAIASADVLMVEE